MALHEAKSVEVAWHKAHQNKHRPLPIEQNNFQVSLQLVVNWSKTLKTWRLQDFRISTEHVETLWMTKAVSCIAWRSMTYDYHEMFHVEFLTISMVVDTGYLLTFGMELLGSRHCTRVGSTSRSGSARGKLSVSIWTIDIVIAMIIVGYLAFALIYRCIHDICIETNSRFGMSHADSLSFQHAPRKTVGINRDIHKDCSPSLFMKSGTQWIWIKTVGAEEAPRNGARCIGILDSKHFEILKTHWNMKKQWKTYFSVWVICRTRNLVRCHFSVISIKALCDILCHCYSWSCVLSHSLTQQTCWNVRSPSKQCFNMALGHVLAWPCEAHNVSLRADAERELASAASVVSANLQTKETPLRLSSFS